MADEVQPKKKHRKGLWITLGVVAFLIIVIVAAGNSAPKKVGETNATNTTTNSSTDFTANDVIQLGDYQLKIDKVERNWTSNNDYDRPESGKEYVLVAVTITNTGKNSIPYNSYDFKLQDSNGVQKSEAFTTGENKLNSGDLAQGGKVAGNLVFEAPKGDAGLKLIFNPTLLGKDAVIQL